MDESLEERDMIEQPQKRIRINVKASTKGLKTYDVTVEIADVDADVVLHESDKLVAALDWRYPSTEKR
tara:strand:- start:2638 stop:2841 length:204 start_codon:yes stop_codon:yes gene_type:complete